MKIEKINLEYVTKNEFTSVLYDKICHIKTLPYFSIVQAVEGNYDIQLAGGKKYNTGNKGFFVAPSNIQQTILHNADKESKRMSCRWIFMKIKINEIYDFDKLYEFPEIVPDNIKDTMNTLFDNVFNCNNPFEEYAYYYEIVKLLSSIAKEKKYITKTNLTKATDYIHDNYSNKITVKDIAEYCNLSESHLFSVFKKETGISPISFLNSYRLSIAAEELIKNEKNISEISYMVGINDSVYFNKLFRKAYQMSPTQYRILNQGSFIE